MNRREFLQLLSAMGMGLALPRCGDDHSRRFDDFDVAFDGNVLIVGAGAAGMAAAYLLKRYNVAFEVLEASERFGGRVRRDDSLADFPLDLGAEWIHHDPSILATLIDDRSVDDSLEVIVYSPQSTASWHRGRARVHDFASQYYREYKFSQTTWYGYLERYFAPAMEGSVSFGAVVTRIDTSGERVAVHTSDGQVRLTDRVILTAPIKVLQEGDIAFTPPLTPEKADALSAVDFPEGIKVFTSFERPFYPDIMIDGPLFREVSYDKLYYNAAFRKKASSHVLGLFWVSHKARRFTTLPDDALIAAVIDELDERFSGAASRYYIDHRIQNWSQEPYIRGAYSVDFRGDQNAIVRELRRPIANRVFLAGEALHIEEQATVHGAMLSAYETVERLLANRSG